ncbi:asparaginase [Arthrobacter sp. NPDC080031]|uniref:asparaginase n=1 Tax=Arthrobacter sp. NPDC080031 TaxID=3155918 RepID=UPI00344F3C79
MTRRPRVALISTGGTIDAVGASRLDLAWYTETKDRLPDGGLLAALPELGMIADVVQVPFARMPSYALTTADWSLLASTVQDLAAGRGYDGIVVTHGTNTLEETAFLLSLTVSTAIPVVFVGAMRPANGLGSDGAINLFQAVRLAASEQARGQGVLVMLNDTVFAARDATKTSTFRVNAFTAPGFGPLGHVDADGEIRLSHVHATNAVPAFGVGDIAGMPRVDVVLSYVGADGALIEAAVNAGARGIVSAGTGAGRPTPAESEALDAAAAKGVVVCQGTRVFSGRVSRSPAMRAARRVTAPAMAPWQARIALALTLQRTNDIDEVQITLDAL